MLCMFGNFGGSFGGLRAASILESSDVVDGAMGSTFFPVRRSVCNHDKIYYHDASTTVSVYAMNAVVSGRMPLLIKS